MSARKAVADSQAADRSTRRREQNAVAKRAQRVRDAAAGYALQQIKLPRAMAEKLGAALRMPGFEEALGRFLDDSIVEVAAYPQLKFLCWNRRDVFLPAAEAFSLYEQNWRFIDEKALTVAERELIERLTLTFGKGVLNA